MLSFSGSVSQWSRGTQACALDLAKRCFPVVELAGAMPIRREEAGRRGSRSCRPGADKVHDLIAGYSWGNQQPFRVPQFLFLLVCSSMSRRMTSFLALQLGFEVERSCVAGASSDALRLRSVSKTRGASKNSFCRDRRGGAMPNSSREWTRVLCSRSAVWDGDLVEAGK